MSEMSAAGSAQHAPSIGYESEQPTKLQPSFLRKAIHDTFDQFGAKAGSVWIVLLVVLAVSAPYIASTHPILMKADGKWSSPMWRNLTPVDLILTALAITFLIMWLVRKATFAHMLIALVATVALIGPAAYLFKKPPETVNYQMYRDMERQGRMQFALRTIIPYSPTDRLRDMPERRLQPPTRSNWLGTEPDGADLLSRMIHSTRIALSIGLISTTISVFIGILVGGVMGYYVGKVDLLGMRLIEVFEAIPGLLVLITVMAAYGRNIYLMMVVIGLLYWTQTARFIRAEFLRLRQQDFVQAAIASGLPRWIVIYRHILPNALTPVLVTATFSVASAILTESVLSFLGLGLIDQPSWGQMLSQARSGGIGFVWWMAIFPGAAIFLTVYAYALIGDAIRDAIDPKLKKRD
jgi:peptide/nickel transport system permease protein